MATEQTQQPSSGFLGFHSKIERNVTLMLVLSLLVVTIGGIVEISPLFWLENTIEKVKGMRPYTPLELAGRNIYVREGCYVCHSQMIRPFRDEVERYGHYSLAAESMFDHPFQWGSKRTGPDLARVGGRYSNDWHVQHLRNPRDVVPESVMPPYAFLANNDLDPKAMAAHLVANQDVGVPYSQAMVDNSAADMLAQANPDLDNTELLKRYPKAVVGAFDGDPERLTEMDALIAYLQMLGTLVDFSAYEPEKIRDRDPP
jgi:cytochrome c oxidase cbb3-type subunit II